MPGSGVIARRLAPFAGAALLGYLLGVAPGAAVKGTELTVSVLITVVITIGGILCPWGRLPRAAQLLAPLGYLVAVALLRDSAGGTGAGFGPLLLLPVFWVALYGTRGQLAVVLAGVAAVHYLPMLLIGGEAYPAANWRGGALFVVVSAIVGYTTLDLISRVRRANAERAELLGRLEQLVTSDSLTGLLNRRGWDAALARALDDAAATGAPVTIAMLDLDHFKRVNDAHGHSHGDRVLRESAAAWQAELRPGDTIARVGGEEFALILGECAWEDARAVVERIRHATFAGHTASAGIAQWDRAEPGAALVARADTLLYEAKRRGRDRSVTQGELLRAV